MLCRESQHRHYAECHYAECHYAECHYAECYYAECHYADCRGAVSTASGQSYRDFLARKFQGLYSMLSHTCP
jgi:hypothetical protein